MAQFMFPTFEQEMQRFENLERIRLWEQHTVALDAHRSEQRMVWADAWNQTDISERNAYAERALVAFLKRYPEPVWSDPYTKIAPSSDRA